MPGGKQHKIRIGKWETVAFVCILFWGIIYSLVFIPFSAPDESAHFATAYQLSNQILGQEAVNEEGLVLVREEDAVLLSYTLDDESYEQVFGRFFERDHSEERIGYGHRPMDVSRHAYLPQALGITAGRLFGLGQIAVIYLGRLFNLLFFAVCAALAVRLAPFGRMAFLGVCLFPMTLELVSSLSYDAMAIGLAMLFTAYVLHLAYEAEAVKKREIMILGLLLGFLAPCKMIYIPLAGLCFLIPRKKFGSGKSYGLAAAAVAFCMAAGVVWINLDKILVYFGGTEEAVEWAGGVQGYSISYVLAHPLDGLFVIVNTMVRRFPFYIHSMTGGLLGWMQYETDEVLIVFFLFWTFLAVQPEKGEEEKRPGEHAQIFSRSMVFAHRAVSLLLCLFTVTAALLVMLLSWTPLDSAVVEGVQGRYFLPVLPLALLAIRSRRIWWEESMRGIWIGGYSAANLLVILNILGELQ